MSTLDDQQAVQLERAQADARFWETLAEMQICDVAEHSALLVTLQRAITDGIVQPKGKSARLPEPATVEDQH